MIMIVGVFTFIFIDSVAGIAFLVLGVVLYWLLYRFARRLDREIKEAKPPSD